MSEILLKSIDLYKQKYSTYFNEHYEIIKLDYTNLENKIETKEV